MERDKKKQTIGHQHQVIRPAMDVTGVANPDPAD